MTTTSHALLLQLVVDGVSGRRGIHAAPLVERVRGRGIVDVISRYQNSVEPVLVTTKRL